MKISASFIRKKYRFLGQPWETISPRDRRYLRKLFRRELRRAVSDGEISNKICNALLSSTPSSRDIRYLEIGTLTTIKNETIYYLRVRNESPGRVSSFVDSSGKICTITTTRYYLE